MITNKYINTHELLKKGKKGKNKEKKPPRGWGKLSKCSKVVAKFKGWTNLIQSKRRQKGLYSGIHAQNFPGKSHISLIYFMGFPKTAGCEL